MINIHTNKNFPDILIQAHMGPATRRQFDYNLIVLLRRIAEGALILVLRYFCRNFVRNILPDSQYIIQWNIWYSRWLLEIRKSERQTVLEYIIWMPHSHLGCLVFGFYSVIFKTLQYTWTTVCPLLSMILWIYHCSEPSDRCQITNDWRQQIRSRNSTRVMSSKMLLVNLEKKVTNSRRPLSDCEMPYPKLPPDILKLRTLHPIYSSALFSRLQRIKTRCE